MTKDTPDSIKILMLAEAGFQPIPLAKKYLKLVRFVKYIKSRTQDGDEYYRPAKEAQELLKEIEEID